MEGWMWFFIVIGVIFFLGKLLGKGKSSPSENIESTEQRKSPGRRLEDWFNAYDNSTVSKEEFIEFLKEWKNK